MSALVTRTLDYTSAHEYVQRNKNVRWEGWDIVTWVPTKNDKSFFMKNGAFNKSRPSGRGWGIEFRTTVGADGNWRVKVQA